MSDLSRFRLALRAKALEGQRPPVRIGARHLCADGTVEREIPAPGGAGLLYMVNYIQPSPVGRPPGVREAYGRVTPPLDKEPSPGGNHA